MDNPEPILTKARTRKFSPPYKLPAHQQAGADNDGKK